MAINTNVTGFTPSLDPTPNLVWNGATLSQQASHAWQSQDLMRDITDRQQQLIADHTWDPTKGYFVIWKRDAQDKMAIYLTQGTPDTEVFYSHTALAALRQIDRTYLEDRNHRTSPGTALRAWKEGQYDIALDAMQAFWQKIIGPTVDTTTCIRNALTTHCPRWNTTPTICSMGIVDGIFIAGLGISSLRSSPAIGTGMLFLGLMMILWRSLLMTQKYASITRIALYGLIATSIFTNSAIMWSTYKQWKTLSKFRSELDVSLMQGTPLAVLTYLRTKTELPDGQDAVENFQKQQSTAKALFSDALIRKIRNAKSHQDISSLSREIRQYNSYQMTRTAATFTIALTGTLLTGISSGLATFVPALMPLATIVNNSYAFAAYCAVWLTVDCGPLSERLFTPLAHLIERVTFPEPQYIPQLSC